MKDVLALLAKIVLILLGLTKAETLVNLMILGSSFSLGTTTLTISVNKMEDIMEIVKSLEKSG